MKKIGIICEYNPLHNGHIYHIKKIKEMFPDSSIIAVMSGNFTQRGDLSLIEKKDKANIALNYGIDLVIELPFIFATQSADVFADAAIRILNQINIDYLIFGSESNNIKLLTSLANIQLNNIDYNKQVKILLDEGINYPTAMSQALKKFSNETIRDPNDLLGLSYVKAIIKTNSKIIPLTIKRTNDFHSIESNDTDIISASAIRNLFLNNKKIDNFVPEKVKNILCNNNKNYNYYYFLKYKILSEGKNIKKYLTVDEGIENRLLKYIEKTDSIEELIEKVKTKRYTYNKISRMFIHILCSLTKEEANKNKDIKFIRVLAFNEVGQKILSNIKKDMKIPLITTEKYCKDLLEFDTRIDKLYNMITKSK